MSGQFPWGVLGIAPTADRKAIRTAYAARLKALDVDADVAGFEELRAAREEALYLAAQDEPAAPPPELADAVVPAMEWDAPLTADELLPDAPTPLTPAPRQETPPEPYDERPDRLLALLYPGGEYSGDPLAPEDYAEAEALQRALVAEAQASAIDKQHGIETWLAHHLASAWPRSGPLVEESGAAFGWDRAAGQLDENPAVAFLNNRLKAIAFVQQIEQTDHPLHHEWAELKQPGRRGFNPLRKARIDKMKTLLGTIRSQHPEVEEYLSPQKVQDWDVAHTRETSGGGFNWIWVLGPVFLLSAIGRCASAVIPENSTLDKPPEIALSNEWNEAQKLGLIDEVLGNANTYDVEQFDTNQGPVWEQMRNIAYISENDRAVARAQAIDLIRNWSMITADNADFDLLVEAKSIKLELMRQILAQKGADLCIVVSQSGPLPPDIVLTETLRDRERALARALLDEGLLDSRPEGGTAQANIPGNIFEAARNDADLSEADAVLAATGQGTNAQQCTFRIALAEQVLRRPGDVSADLLKVL